MIVICYFKQKTAYEERIRDWSSDVCSSDRDAGDDAALVQDVDQRGAVLGLLAQRLVVEDDTGDILFGARGGEQHLAIVAAVLLGRRPVDAGQEIGRASCRERGCQDVQLSVRAESIKELQIVMKNNNT